MPWLLVSMVLLLTGLAAIGFLHKVFRRNVNLQGKESLYFFIRSSDRFGDVVRRLDSAGILNDTRSFEWVAARKNYPLKVRPGRYLIRDGMRNHELVDMLRSGQQVPVRLRVRNFRNTDELAGYVSSVIEADSAGIMTLLRDSLRLQTYGLNETNVLTLFLPDTYEFFWNTSAERFISRMAAESERFWHSRRKEKAANIGLGVVEVIILASIVEKETNMEPEKPLIASVYLNRIRAGMPLQADPTVIFAWNDYTIRRVLHLHTRIDSPYNTYRVRGLPPGPICIPSKSTIDAVLNAPETRYFYFCAKEDFSGSHRFASTLAEHNRNARLYRSALDKLNIR